MINDSSMYIHSIDSLSIVDGPGTRFVVFTQGCNLRCKFCHNPDTWKMHIGEEVELTDLYRKIQNAKSFFTKLGGGVTFTGGEPLMQLIALTKICKKLKEDNIHVTIDTAGNFKITDDVKELLKYVDLVMLDIKHINDDIHKDLTGFSNKQILEFARYLSENNIKTRIRVVYMPTITDSSDEDLVKLKQFISSLKTLEKVEVLPYHTMGIKKWEDLHMNYELSHVKVPTDEETSKLQEYLLK